MQAIEKIIKCYDTTASKYATERIDEIYKNNFDSLLLKEFASINKNNGTCADFGCGPGHTTKFLYENGLVNIVGIDISSEMIKNAKRIFPKIEFKSDNLLSLSFKEGFFDSAVAFYSIVHFDYDQVKTAFSEVNKVLNSKSQFLLAFHVGKGIEHFDKVDKLDIDIDLYFFQTDKIIELLKVTGFTVIDALERLPYGNMEYRTKRGYVWAEKE